MNNLDYKAINIEKQTLETIEGVSISDDHNDESVTQLYGSNYYKTSSSFRYFSRQNRIRIHVLYDSHLIILFFTFVSIVFHLAKFDSLFLQRKKKKKKTIHRNFST